MYIIILLLGLNGLIRFLCNEIYGV